MDFVECLLFAYVSCYNKLCLCLYLGILRFVRSTSSEKVASDVLNFVHIIV